MAIVLGVSCGDESGDGAGTAPPTAAGGAALTAASLIPDLTSLGFTKGQAERDPAALPGQDAYRALFQQQAAPQMGARVDITVVATEADAAKQWETLSVALRNPPPDIFGSASTQKDATATSLGNQSRAYMTAKPDTSGTQVWTDIYRFGRAIAVVQVLSRNEPEAQKARIAIAEKIRDKAK